jgi:hypothetical protein
VPANKEPIYTLTPHVESCVPVLVCAGTDGVGFVVSGGTVTHYIAFTPGANGSYVKEARIKIATTNGTTAVAATTIRFFISTVSSGATSSANTRMIAEVAIPTITPATTSASPDFIVPLNFALETGKYLLCCTGVVANANTYYMVTTFGGDY